MQHMPIDHKNSDFILDGRKIVDGDVLELKWPDNQTVTTIVKLIHGELRIVGTVRGVKCWIILDLGLRKQEILAKWKDKGEKNEQNI